jgi:O-antigen/teichoic acid export membrane protein
MQAVAEASTAAPSHDSLEAVRSALKLGTSLLFTLAMSFGIRLLLPRYLGPEQFGAYKFADAFAATFFVALGLGLDVYIRREVAVQPNHATGFFGGILITRVVLTALLFAAMGWVLRAGHRSVEEQHLVYAFGVAQLLVTTNTSLASLLQARGTVDGLSVSGVLTKVLWGVLILAALWFRTGLLGLALALVISEAVKAAILSVLVNRHLGWRLTFNAGATWAVIVASLPFFLNTVAHTVYNKLGVSMLAFLSADDAEVGRYAAAAELAGLTLLVTPLIGWVLTPLYAKAQHRSEDEFNATLRRSLELILVLGFPVSLLLGVGAEVWMRLAFGAPFVDGALPLRILAPLFLLTYVAMVAGTCLVNLRRAWTLTAISLVGLVINPLLNWALIHLALRAVGSAGGGAACALADVGTEIAVTGVMLYLVGRRAFDRRSLAMIAKTLTVCAGVILVDRLLVQLGPARLMVDALVYTAGVVGTRAVRPHEVLEIARSALRHRHRESVL